MGKKVMYTHLSQRADDEKSSYFGESALDDAEVKPGKCKYTMCKVILFVVVIVAMTGIYIVSSLRKAKPTSPSLLSKEEKDAQEHAVMRPYRKHFGSTCMHPVRHELSDILLAINFNHPYYSNIPILRRLYKHVFPHQVYCGPERDPTGKFEIIEVAQPVMQRGFYGYHCLALAMKKKPGFTGYLYVNDDMIINWWMFLDLDKSRIWTGKLASLKESTQVGSAPKTQWWKRADSARRCTEVFLEIETEKSEALLKQYYKNTNNERICVNGWSDIFYIPARFSDTFMELSTIFYDHLVFVEAAVQMTMLYLDDRNNFVLLNGVYLPEKFGYGVDYGLPGMAWQVYTRGITFLHPYKLSSKENRDLFQDILVEVSNQVVRTSCLDIVQVNKRGKIKSHFKWKNAVKVDWSKYRR